MAIKDPYLELTTEFQRHARPLLMVGHRLVRQYDPSLQLSPEGRAEIARINRVRDLAGLKPARTFAGKCVRVWQSAQVTASDVVPLIALSHTAMEGTAAGDAIITIFAEMRARKSREPMTETSIPEPALKDYFDIPDARKFFMGWAKQTKKALALAIERQKFTPKQNTILVVGADILLQALALAIVSENDMDSQMAVCEARLHPGEILVLRRKVFAGIVRATGYEKA